MTNIIETINPMAETKQSFLGVMKARNMGRGNITIGVNKWYKPGEKINIIKKDNMFLLSKQPVENSIQRTVRTSGPTFMVSLMNIASEGYYSVHKKGKDLAFIPATTEETLRFARKITRTKTGECLIYQMNDYRTYIKREDLKMFSQNAILSAEFHCTEDNLMWFEVFEGQEYSAGATKCTFTDGFLSIPLNIAKKTNLNKGDILTCWKNNNRLIVELPNISCETCNNSIRRKTNKSKTLTVSQSTKDVCEIVRHQVEKSSQNSKQMQFIEALKTIKTINNLLNGGN